MDWKTGSASAGLHVMEGDSPSRHYFDLLESCVKLSIQLPRRAGVLKNLARVPTLLGVLLAAVTLLLYAPLAQHQFLALDDAAYITNNIHVRTGWSVANFVWAFKDVHTFYWQPITWLSHMTDCQLFGVNPGAHHMVSALLQAVNALLLFAVLRLATGATWRSFAVAAIFAVHPLNVEVVAWAAERKSLLSAIFTFLALLAYGWYVRKPNAGRYAAVAGCFALALMSKPMAVTFPALLMVVDVWPLGRYSGQATKQQALRLFVEKLPLFAMSAASTAVTVFGNRTSFVPMHSGGSPMRLGLPILTLATYLRRIFWPSDLLPMYPVPTHALPWPALGLSLLVLCVMTGLAIHFRRFGYPLAGWIFYLVGLLPVLGIVRVGVTVSADRFTYISAIGIVVMVVWAAGDLIKAGFLARLPVIVAALIAVTLFATVARRDLGYWKNDLQLWGHERQQLKHPDPLVEMYYGDGLLRANRTKEALAAYQRSCHIAPGNDLCHYSAALILHSQRRYREALQQYQSALRLTRLPYVRTYSLINIGKIFLTTGNAIAAQQALYAALELDPRNPDALHLLGELRRR
jgi:hypothetical protein